MDNRALILVLIFTSVILALPVTPGIHGPSEAFPYHAELDPNFRLYWKFNSTHITFETHVKTLGYVGLGISPNGKMYPSDVILAWVKDGHPYLQDRHTTGHSPPLADASQDWVLLSASEDHDTTVIKVQRKLETCDDDDLPILEGTTRVIYAYHPDDPSDQGRVPYHGTTRGAKSLLLLDPPPSETDMKDDPSDFKVFDILARNYTIPAQDTTYHCTTYMLPDLGTKHHMIKYEPIIQPGNENHVHHFLIYSCMVPMSQRYDGLSFDCYTSKPPQLATCYNMITAWAIGGKEFVFPDDVGFPMGYSGEARFLLMEVHYDNPHIKSGIVDNSGLRIHLTSQVRKYDAGIFMTGVSVNQFHVIPPQSPGFVSRAYCPSECIDQSFQKAGVDKIHVFANLLHSHLLGHGMKVRVIRGHQEIAPLAEDNNYDFDYQEMRMLHNEYILQKGDRLILECEYESMDRTKPTTGGLGTRDEMCETFAIYYPRMPLLYCNSEFSYNNLPTEESSITEYVKKLDFSLQETHTNFTRLVDDSDVNVQCVESGGYFTQRIVTKTQSEMQPSSPYVKPSRCP